MSRLSIYGSCMKEFIYPLPTLLFVNYANQFEIQLSWWVFNLVVSFLKKGWF